MMPRERKSEGHSFQISAASEIDFGAAIALVVAEALGAGLFWATETRKLPFSSTFTWAVAVAVAVTVFPTREWKDRVGMSPLLSTVAKDSIIPMIRSSL
jgi:hypothetical protein